MKKLIAILASLAVLAGSSALLVSADNESPSVTPVPTSGPTATPSTSSSGSHSGGNGGAGETDEEEEMELPEDEIVDDEVPLAELPEIPEELLLAQEEATEATDYSVVDEIDYTTVSPQTGYAAGWDIRGL